MNLLPKMPTAADSQDGAMSALMLISFVYSGEKKSENYLYGNEAIAFTGKWDNEYQAAK